jgi:hypothetical protein
LAGPIREGLRRARCPRRTPSARLGIERRRLGRAGGGLGLRGEHLGAGREPLTL